MEILIGIYINFSFLILNKTYIIDCTQDYCYNYTFEYLAEALRTLCGSVVLSLNLTLFITTIGVVI